MTRGVQEKKARKYVSETYFENDAKIVAWQRVTEQIEGILVVFFFTAELTQLWRRWREQISRRTCDNLPNRARGHFVTLTDVNMHPITCTFGHRREWSGSQPLPKTHNRFPEDSLIVFSRWRCWLHSRTISVTDKTVYHVLGCHSPACTTGPLFQLHSEAEQWRTFNRFSSTMLHTHCCRSNVGAVRAIIIGSLSNDDSSNETITYKYNFAIFSILRLFSLVQDGKNGQNIA